jgi:hypothetical protein
MTDRARQQLTKYFLTVLVLFLMAVILILSQRFAAKKTETALRDVSASALQSKLGEKIVLGERIAVAGSGFPGGTYAFSVTNRGKADGIAFVSAIMGNSGPYTGVFYWTADEGARLVSIVGLDSPDAGPERFGITARALDACERRLDAIADRAGGAK